MGKSAAYKRRLRRSQKLKKRQKAREYRLLHGNGAHQENADLGSSPEAGAHTKHEEHQESASGPEAYVGTGAHSERENHCLDLRSALVDTGVHTECEELPAVSENDSSSSENNEIQADNLSKELSKARKHIKYYRNKIEKQEQIIDVMEEACVKRIQFVRHFWRNKIYKEGSRAGRILKKAMQN